MMQTPGKTPVVEAIGLKKQFFQGGSWIKRQKEGTLAVDDVSLAIYPGETVGLVGESGSGKSTFGKCLLRIFQPTEGKVIFNGTDITHLPSSQLRPILPQMQLVFQNPYSSLNPRMRIKNIIAEPLQVQRMGSRREIEAKVKDLVTLVGLSVEHLYRLPHELSGGQRQRVAIARALAMDPKFLVLDEPTSALDVSVQAQIINLVIELQQKFGFSYLFISHNLAVIRHVCDRVFLMYRGRVVESGPKHGIFESPCHPYTKVLLSANPEFGSKKPDIDDADKEGTGIQLKSSGCSFADRCSAYLGEPCDTAKPALVEVAEGHFVACHQFTPKGLTMSELASK
jgi:oligopeptide/dipeptide ABC transporter ATP-binding protein